MKDRKRVLFSPIGTTDPIRDCYDGGCLHIVRHYRPQKVVLYLTKQMAKLEDKDQRFSKSIHSIDKNIEIKLIYSNVDGGFNYDDLFPNLVDAIRAEKQDDVELLINLSSGTPQIKNIMAIYSVEDSLKAIQVTTPAKDSNVDVPHLGKDADIDTVIANNLDDLEDAENRCVEPKLSVIRFYAEKHRIISLISRYEYAGAWELAKQSDMVSESTKKLIQHAYYRQRLQTAEAREVLSNYAGISLFPYDKKNLECAEYFLVLQQDQQNGKLNETLVKMNNVLYEALKVYLENRYKIRQYMNSYREIKRDKLDSGLIAAFDYEYGNFRDSELSFRNECIFCNYYAKMTDADKKHISITASLNKLSKLSGNRNMTAHTITNFTEQEFARQMELSSSEAVNEVANIMTLLLGDGFRKYRGMYNSLNKWIEQGLMESD